MRPDPKRSRLDEQSDRIIYLGDVRKRRARKRQTPDRYYLTAFILTAAMFWAAWLTVVLTLAPSRLLTYVAFFLPLSGALITTGTVVFYAIDWYRGVTPAFRICLRRALLSTIVIVINLASLGARFWLLPIGVVTIAAAIMVEIAIKARGHR